MKPLLKRITLKRSRSIKFRALVALVVVLAATGLAAYYVLILPAQGPPLGEPIRIGVLAPFTGPFAAGGFALNQSLQLAAEDVNARGGILGRRVMLAVADSQGRADVARVQALRLIDQDKVVALIGAYLSEETIAVEEVVAETKTPLIVPIAATLEITQNVLSDYVRYRYVFRVAYNLTQWAHLMGDFIVSMKVGNYSFAGVDIRWNREYADTLRDFLQQKGIAQVYQGFYSAQNPVIDPMIMAIRERNPDLVVLGDPGRGSVEAVKKARQFKLRSLLFSVGGALGDERVAMTLDPGDYLFFQAATWRGISQETTRYFERFRERFKYTPVGYSDTLPYDALQVLAQAIAKAGSLDTEKIITALELGRFEGISGTYSFSAAHQAVWAANTELSGTVVRWVNGTSVVVWPKTLQD